MGALERIGEWLDERTGWRAALREATEHPVAGGPSWASAMAAAVAACFGVLALTGVALMTTYEPSPQSAWASVFYVQFVQDRGWIVRGLHHWAAQGLVALAALHVVHGAWAGAYRKPREIAWWLTLLLVALAVGEGITGGLLPWDQRGWWARVVEGNIVGLAPAVGGWLQRMMQGGSELGAIGLARAYTMHVALLPVAIALVLAARRRLARRAGWGGGAATGPWAQQVARSVLVALLVVVAVFAATGWTRGAPLDAPADPMSDYPARPEWFLLTLFELRKLCHGAGELWGTTLAPLAVAGYLALLPWIDRAGRPRALTVKLPLAAIVAGALGLAVLPLRKDARDARYAKQRAEADALAAAAVKLAMRGVPPEGALAMMRHDPELRGKALFEQHCASCHVLGGAGDGRKATAATLDGWGTPEWIAAMIHDPDAPRFFGRGPYAEEMPSVDVRPAKKPADEPWSPTIASEAEKRAVAVFLAAQGDEPGDPPRAVDAATRALGEKILSERCTTCHLYGGQGDDDGSGIAPELRGYGSVAWTRAQVADPATARTYRDQALDPKRKKHMPRFDGDLSAADVDLVARWTRAHARGVPLR